LRFLLPMTERDEGRAMACKCHECGGYYKIDILVSDNIWEKIKPSGVGREAGLLCPVCIAHKICTGIQDEIGYAAFRLERADNQEKGE